MSVDTGQLDEKAKIREQIFELVEAYAALEFQPQPFEPGKTVIPASG